ncbi:putative amidoligase enzyme-domain-containing protein [Xylariaceae sp. FL1272]|nr:putative amidoligase enzyme-domain-containing protein [Xylariaceae sp. FL1272]
MSSANTASFGLELECLIAVARNNQPLTVPEMFQHSSGGPLFVPSQTASSQSFAASRPVIQRAIATALNGFKGKRVISPEQDNQPYKDWAVERDTSVLFPPELRSLPKMGDYTWQTVEITSPALWHDESSWREIKLVVDAIARDFWVLTPETAGIHFHYGNGPDYIPFFQLRRLAAFFFAADPLLCQLHPPHRHGNMFCASNRLYSYIARGGTPDEAHSQWVEAPPEIRNAANTNPTRSAARRNFPIKRGTLPGYNSKNLFSTDSDSEDGNAPAIKDIPGAVAEILRSTNAPTVAELMSLKPLDIDERMAYNFNNYRQSRYRPSTESDARNGLLLTPGMSGGEKRTIEFRQIASTMDSAEIIAHGKAIMRLCEFAKTSSLHELWSVVVDCAVSETDREWYDVFDLLLKLDLQEEARVLARAVANYHRSG